MYPMTPTEETLKILENQRVYLFRLFGDQRDGMLLSNETRENRCAFASGIASCGSTSEVLSEVKSRQNGRQ